tara:strand:- start:14914 stop:15306 length:393 start_codon:yes stop_codon:yes gene_type:complete
MPLLRVSALLLFTLLICGCSSEDAITLKPGETLNLNLMTAAGDTTAWELPSRSPAYARLDQWLKSNKMGWSPHFAPPPKDGLVVSTSAWRLYFVAEEVIACQNHQGCVRKFIPASEYEFLLQTLPTKSGV